MPSRAIASYPATIAVTTSRPDTPSLSATASAVGTTTAEACVIDTAWVSSKSSPWASVPLTSAAPAGDAVRIEPMMLHGPPSEIVRDPHAALRRARELADTDGVVIATGSIYLVGDLLAPVGRRRASML